MEKKEIISSISAWGRGEIYLGVVGAVRTGKSTFIKKVIETLIIPNIEDEDLKKRCWDEVPQSAPGRNPMAVRVSPGTSSSVVRPWHSVYHGAAGQGPVKSILASPGVNEAEARRYPGWKKMSFWKPVLRGMQRPPEVWLCGPGRSVHRRWRVCRSYGDIF